MSSTLLALKNAEVFSSSVGIVDSLTESNGDLFAERGFVFGDGYFDTMRFERNHVPLWAWHRNRIVASSKRLGFIHSENQQINFEQLVDLSYERICHAILLQNLNSNSSSDAALIIKFIITGGELSAGSYPHSNAIPNIYVAVRRLIRSRNVPDTTLRLSLLPIPHNKELSGIKHLSRSNYTLSAKHALNSEHDLINRHVLFLDTEKNIIETMNHNVFIVADGVLKTPRLDNVGVSGVMRRWVLDTLSARSKVSKELSSHEECELSVENICNADEVFISNAIDGLVRIKGLEVPAVYNVFNDIDSYRAKPATLNDDFKYSYYDTSDMPVFDALSKLLEAELTI